MVFLAVIRKGGDRMNTQILTITAGFILGQFIITAITTKDYRAQGIESISLVGLGLLLSVVVK